MGGIGDCRTSGSALLVHSPGVEPDRLEHAFGRPGDRSRPRSRGADGGAVSKSGVVEKEVALKIALHLRDYLQEAGALVVMTREKDTDLADSGTRGLSRRKTEDLMRRVRIVKESGADALVSIHLNAIPSPRWKGAQTFYHPESEENKKLASFIQAELIRNLGNTNRLPKQNGDIFILKASPVPAAMVEVGFLSNPEEAARLGDEKYQKKLAAAIYYGILRYYTEENLPPEMISGEYDIITGKH